MIINRFVSLILLGFVTFFANAMVGQVENSVKFPHLKLSGRVKLPSNSLNSHMIFEPKKPVNVLPFLADSRALAFCRLTEAEVEEIESALSRVEATLVELIQYPTDQSRMDVAKIAINDGEKWASQLVDAKLSEIESVIAFFHLKQGTIFRQEEFRDLHHWLLEPEFWEKVADPARELRTKTLEQIIDILEPNQKNKFIELVGKDAAYGTYSRTDVLVCQLNLGQLAKVKGGSRNGPFSDFGLMGTFSMEANGKVNFRHFSKDCRQIPIAAKIRLLRDPNLSERLTIVDFQRDQLIEIETRLQEVGKAVDEEIAENIRGRVLAPKRLVEESNRFGYPAYIEVELDAHKEIDEILLPHQKNTLKAEIAVQLLPTLGIRHALTEGNLAEILSVTPQQKEKIVDQCLKGAKSLASKTNDLEAKLVALLKKRFPDSERIQKLTDNFQLEGRCASPDSILPLEYHNDLGVEGQCQSDQSLRDHFFKGK